MPMTAFSACPVGAAILEQRAARCVRVSLSHGKLNGKDAVKLKQDKTRLIVTELAKAARVPNHATLSNDINLQLPVYVYAFDANGTIQIY